MRRTELEKTLRSYEPMKGVSVEWPDAFTHAMCPTMYVIRGIVNVRGEPHAYELEIDGRSLQTREDVEMLVKALLSSFEKAELTAV